MHKVQTGTSSIASCARCSRCSTLETAARAGATLGHWGDGDGLACALGSLHKSDAGLDLNVLANQNFLLERILAGTAASTAKGAALATSKGRKEVVKVEASAKATLSTTEAARKRVARSSKWITTGRVAVGVEASSAELIELFLLLGIGQDFVGGLNVGKSFFGRVVFVGIGVVFLG